MNMKRIVGFTRDDLYTALGEPPSVRKGAAPSPEFLAQRRARMAVLKSSRRERDLSAMSPRKRALLEMTDQIARDTDTTRPRR